MSLVQALAFLLRVYSALFHLVLSLFLFGIGVFGLVTGTGSLKMAMLPWFNGPNLRAWLVGLGLVGALSALLALRGKARGLLLIWSAFALVVVVYGFFVAPYAFRSRGDAANAGWLCLAAVIALAGAWMGWRKTSRD